MTTLYVVRNPEGAVVGSSCANHRRAIGDFVSRVSDGSPSLAELTAPIADALWRGEAKYGFTLGTVEVP